MKINIVIIAIVVVAVIAFVYFVVKRNRKDQKDLEQELNQKEVTSKKHNEAQV